MSPDGLARLRSLAEFGEFGVIREELSRQLSGGWFAGEPAVLSRAYRRLRDALRPAPRVGRLLDLHLLLAPLDGRPRPPSWAFAWVERNVPVPSFFPGDLYRRFPEGRWRCAPLLLLDETGARLRRLLTGYAPGPESAAPWPDWAEPLMDSSAREALRDALRAAERLVPRPAGFRPWIIPLAAEDADGTGARVSGRSLGLPAALGLTAAARDRPLHPRLAASGGLEPGGRVTPAAGLDRKAERAARSGFRVFLRPPGGEPDRDGLRTLAVPTLARARLLAGLFAPGRSGELALLSGMLDDPDRFLANVDGLPPEWLGRVRENGDHRSFLAALGARPERFAAFADRLESAVYANRTRRAGAMAALLDDETLGRLSGRAPLAAFRWCTAALSLCNHTGRVPEARVWSRRAEALLPQARRADLDRAADYFNHRLVARHNRYRFSPELPPDLSGLLKLLTDQYRIQCAADCPTRMVLGRAWGTVAQNHAFCGPAHLDRVRELTARARRALGEDTVPEHREEWLRQFNYLAYALLDAGPVHRAEARDVLFRYVEIDDWSDLWPRFSRISRWRHALIARFLADAGGEGERTVFLAAAENGGPRPRPAFPWPLWCFNVGRAARSLGEETAARSWFERAVGLCMAPEVGPSVRAMALLPLAALFAMDRPPENFRSLWARILEAAGTLDPDHFRRVKTDAPETVLADVFEAPARLFPFIYR